MEMVVYIRKGNSLEGVSTFVAHNIESEQAIKVVVPDGSSLCGHGDMTCLLTPDGKTHTAHKVLVYCKVGVEGFELSSPE